jgi:FkbM family methyltransferase
MVIGYRFSPDAAPGRAHLDDGEALLIRTVAASGANNFIDVGANCGVWTAIVLDTVPNGSVLAFEPSLSAAAALRMRFENNEQVSIVEVAISDQPGELPFFEIPNADENSSLVTLADVAPRIVPVTTLDQEITARGYSRVDLVKIDVEGYDFHAIRGASQALREHRIRYMQFEYGPAWAKAGSTLTACESFLQSMGYTVLLVHPDGLFKLPLSLYGEYFRYSNFVALAPGELPNVQKIYRGIL